MHLRNLEYGVFAAEWAKFTGVSISGRSAIVDGTDNAAGTHVNPTDNISVINTGSSIARAFVVVDLSTIRSLIGHAPVILQANLAVALWASNAAVAQTLNCYLVKGVVDYTDCTSRMRDATGPIYWYQDAYAPVPGHDIGATPFLAHAFTSVLVADTTASHLLPITGVLGDALRRGVNLEMLLWAAYSSASQGFFFLWNYDAYRRPRIKVDYLFPVEFFQSDAVGNCDLTKLVRNDLAENLYYLGALERGAIGSPVKGFVRNFSGRTLGLVEVLDDHPEWSDPVQVAGTGTGKLDYVQLSTAAVSQKYTIIFTSSTAYWVKAEAYRDNIISLNSTNSDALWRGTVGADLVCPEGSCLTIPKAGWQLGTLNGDEIEVYVRGNSSDQTWPADSAAQMQITGDVGGVADSTGWRLINGRRARSKASVTIDAATKKIPVTAIQASDWPVDTHAFIGDGVNLHEGHVESAQVASVGATSHAGGTHNDLTFSGNYNGTWENTIYVEIDATGATDTYKLSIDGGSNFITTGVACTLAAALLSDGIYGAFAAVTGHTLGEHWSAPVQPFAVELSGLTADSTVYAVGARVGTGLPLATVPPGIYGLSTAAAGPSQSVQNRVYMTAPDGSGFVIGDGVYLVDPANADTYEYGEVTAVQPTYIDLDADLTNDYPIGALVAVSGSGERAFWLRAVAGASTTEQLKQARLAARA